MLPRRLHLLPLTVLMFTQSLSAATVASVWGYTSGRSCTAQTSHTAYCSVLYQSPDGDLSGGAIVMASAESLSLSGDIQILSNPHLSVGGQGEFRASFSGLVTIESLTGATGLGFLEGELDIGADSFNDPPVGFDYSLTYGDDVRSGHMDSTHNEGLFTEFTFGKPFPLAAEITARLSSSNLAGLDAFFEVHNLRVNTLEVLDIPSTITYVETPVPELSTSWPVLAGLALLPMRGALPNR